MANLQFSSVLIIGGLIGAAAGYIGSLMLTKKMSLTGGALGHLTLPGIALAFIYHFNIFWGALAFLLGGIFLIWLLEKRTKISPEALTAVVFSSSLAVAFLFLPKNEAIKALIGDISMVSLEDVVIGIVFSLAVFFVTKKIFMKMTLIGISRDLAQAEGINVSLYNFIYLTAIAVTIALGVRIVGSLMTAALVAIPACTSRNLSKNLFQYSYGSAALGALAVVAGILLFRITGIAAGPLIIIISALFFLVSVLVKR